MARQFRVSVYVAILAISGALPAPLLAQPQNPPPKHYSANEAAKMLGGPTLITLKMQDANPADVMKSAVEQAGMKLSYELADVLKTRSPITVNFDRQPFWAVIRALALEMKQPLAIEEGFQLGESTSGWSLGLSKQSLQGPAAVSGPFLIVVNNISRSIDVSSTGNAESPQRAVLEFLVLIDPKVPARGYPDGDKIELRTDAGAPFKNLGPDWNWVHEPRQLSPLVWSMKAIAQLPDANTRRIAKVQGQISGFVSTLAVEKWRIDNVLTAQEQKKSVAGATFVFRDFNKTGGMDYALHVASWGLGETSDAGWPQRTDHDLIGSLRLLNDKAERLPPQSWKIESGKCDVNFRIWPQHGTPTTLIWELPQQVGELEIPFEFADLPLP